MTFLTIVAAFTAGLLLVFGANLLLADIRGERKRLVLSRLENELRQQRRELVRTRASSQHTDLSRLAAEGQAGVVIKQTRIERLVKWIDQAGIGVRPITLVISSVVAGILPAVVAGVIFRHWLIVSAALAVGATIPWCYVSVKRKQRSEKLLSQLPDAFELMGRTLRAGQTIPQALQGVADEFSSPISEEFGYCYDQQNLGLSAEASLQEMAKRTGLLELKIFVVAVAVHRQTGGNLSELLDKLAGVIRDRDRIRGQIKALTAEGRLQAAILLGLPPLLMCVITVVNRDYMATLLQFPWLVVGMFTFEVIGALWLRKIVNFDY